MSRNNYNNARLLQEYTNILTGQRSKYSKNYFERKNDGNSEFGYELFRFAIELFLRWTPEQALKRLDLRTIEKMHLATALPYMDLPPECLFNNDYTYILHKLYPEEIYYNEEEHILRIYNKILTGEKYKWPKKYFSEREGHERAFVCLRYMIDQKMSFVDLKDLFEKFATGEGMKMINQYGLKTVINEFDDPVTFLYESLSDEDKEKSAFYYRYYKNAYYYYKTVKEERQIEKNNKYLEQYNAL